METPLTPTGRQVRKPRGCDAVAAPRLPITAEVGVRKLDIAVLAEAKRTLRETISTYEWLMWRFEQARRVLWWLNGGHETLQPPTDGDEQPPAISFIEACQNNDCDPDESRERLLSKIPEPLQRMLMRSKAPYTCPFCETENNQPGE